MQKINLFEMTRPEVEQAIAAGFDTVSVPLGSTEQHGRHLPLGTDAILGEALRDRVARALGNALLAPGLAIGCSDHDIFGFTRVLVLSKSCNWQAFGFLPISFKPVDFPLSFP